MAEYIPVIGLEIHAELLTKSKVFCNCSAAFGGEHNTRTCPVCAGLPGALPVINQRAVEYAVKAGYSLGCTINKYSIFDRKNYFYPDLPKAFQISQMKRPLCEHGLVEIDTSQGKKKIRINRIHLEEDAGKLIHDDFNNVSYADYNRCGIPLIETVTEPDMHSAEEAQALMEKISLLYQYAGICDCKMEEGSIRCDVNISLMRPGDTKLGTRAELKNINSIKSIGRAINYEIKRQSWLLDNGKKVVQETRRYNENKDKTTSMRSKENAHDYRYFPEPDIQPVNFTDEQLEKIKNSLPEMPGERLNRYVTEYKLNETDARILVNSKKLSDFFDTTCQIYNSPKTLANFILGELLRRVNLGEISVDNLPFTPDDFATLVKMADTEKVSGGDAKKIFREMCEKGGNPEEIAKSHNMLIANDTAKAEEGIDKVLAENASVTEQYRNGETKVFGFLMGKATKALRGVASPKVIKEILENKLKSGIKNTESKNNNKHDENSENSDNFECTKFISADPYKPSKKNGVDQISDVKLQYEFDFSEAVANAGKSVELRACVHKIRKLGKITFIILRAARCIIQSVYTADRCKDKLSGIREGCFVDVKGVIEKNEKAVGGIEIEIDSISLISRPKEELPLKVAEKDLGCSIEVELDKRAVSLRNIYKRAIFKLQEGVANGFRKFMLSERFTEIHSPKIVAQGAEGGANIFSLEYFGKPAFLNQSPQFYKQASIAFFDRVFEIAPVYRAEKHATSRHLNEYIGLDFEMGYIDSMYDVMAIETAMLKYLFKYLQENYKYELDLLEVDVPVVTEIPSVSLLEAKQILGAKGSADKTDLDPDDEVGICEWAKEKFNSDFVFITGFPSSKPPFYAMDDKNDPRLACKFDLLFRGLEITSGGQRIHDYDEQVAKMKRQGLDPNDFKFYLESHKYGLPPHGGAGIGLERLVMKLVGLSNVREASLFPRDINRLLP